MPGEKEMTRFGKTKIGQMLYDLAFVDLTDRWIARKHGYSIAEVRELRNLPQVVKLRKNRATRTS